MTGSVAQSGRAGSVRKKPISGHHVSLSSTGSNPVASNGLATQTANRYRLGPKRRPENARLGGDVDGNIRPLLFKHVNRNTGDSLEAVGTRNRWTKPTELRKGVSLPNSRSPNRVEAGGSLRVFAEESTFFQAAKTTSRGLN